ncbi:MAG: hypothetical protein P4M11_08490 [Candidatus Pacebacteria bacterium]|nr:hypothetical protein [Candidatus Paceibacterota bacterium]
MICYAGCLYLSFRIMIVYKMNTFTTYAFASASVCVAGYCFVKMKHQLMLEGYRVKRRSQKWKRVLDITQDSALICDNDRVLYHNLALDDLFRRSDFTEDGDITLGADRIFEGTEFVDTSGRSIPWAGGKAPAEIGRTLQYGSGDEGGQVSCVQRQDADAVLRCPEETHRVQVY